MQTEENYQVNAKVGSREGYLIDTLSNSEDKEVGIKPVVLNPFKKLLLDQNKTCFQKIFNR